MADPKTRQPASSASEAASSLSIQNNIADLQAGVNRDGNLQLIIERYHNVILRFFSKRGFDQEECRDLTQETFFRMYKGIDSFRNEGSFEGWLFQVAANVYRNTIRNQKAGKRRGQEDSLEGFLEETIQVTDTTWMGAKTRPSPLEDFLEKERMEVLAEALRELPEQMQRCFVLRIHQGLKYREIAIVMKISVETVKAHLYQARQRLRGRLKGHFLKVNTEVPERHTR